jgi:hypothetical protein
MLIKSETFGGIAPKIAPHLLPAQAAQTALNCKFGSGRLEPYKGLSVKAALSKVGTKLSLFRYVPAGVWFHWITDVNAVNSPIGSDPYARVYYTGDTVPKMTANDIATSGGGTGYPTVSYVLGVPAPLVSPTLVVQGTITNDDPSLVESRTYVYTYVSAYGEEGPPCDASLVVDVAPGQEVALSSMSGAPAGNYNITHKRIYRTNQGTSGTEYQLVATILIGQATYTDSIESESLGATLESTTWVAPPSTLSGIIALPCGALAGFSGNELCMSVPYHPHAWPIEYRLSFDSPIVGIGAFGNYILVTTTGMPYIVVAQDPSSAVPEKLEAGQACVSKRGIVDMGYSVLYPAPDGLVSAGSGQFTLITAEILSKEDWQALNPSSINAYYWNGKYVGFYDTGSTTGGFIFDPTTKDFAFTNLYATAGYADLATGKLYLVGVDGNVSEWDAGSTLTLTWKSKPFDTPLPVNMGAGQVFADVYPATLKVYADGSLKHTQTVADALPFRLPAGFLAGRWEFEVIGTSKVNRVCVARTVADLKNG